MAAKNGHESVTYMLIEALCNMHLQGEDGATPLHIAVFNGQVAVTTQLLAAGCNVDHQDEDGFSPLHCAAQADGKNLTEAPICQRKLVQTLMFLTTVK